MKKTVLSVLALSALVFSCKKDDEKSNSEKIVGKWDQVSLIENDHYNNLDHPDTTTYPSGYTIVEFTNTGNMYEKSQYWSDTATYKIDGSNLIMHWGANNDYDTVQIKTLTDTDLQVYGKDPGNNGNFYESLSTFKKK